MTTMSLSARNAASGLAAALGDHVAQVLAVRRRGRTGGSAPSGSGTPTAATPAVGQHRDLVDAVRAQRRRPRRARSRRSRSPPRSAAGRSRRSSRPAGARGAPSSSRRARCSCGRRAARRAVAGPVVHRLEGDQGQLAGRWRAGSAPGPARSAASPTAPGRRDSAATSSCCGLGSSTTSESARISARGGERRRRAAPSVVVGDPNRRAVPVLERDPLPAGRRPRWGRCSGWSGSRCSFSLADDADHAELAEEPRHRFLPGGPCRERLRVSLGALRRRASP